MMRLSPHQQKGYCPMCADDASAFNHCSWCGETFASQKLFDKHLDGSCMEEIFETLFDEPVRDDKVYHCVVCGKNTVDPYQGEDTCVECIIRIRRGGD